jgi:diguanylate cyclase (GGDEF)-like protein
MENIFGSQELRALNEIGLVLSSTLNKEELLRKVWEELGHLFDVQNFYIAFLQPDSDKITFELEVIDGTSIPKRARPGGNHLSEYIIRTRHPVLIRDNFIEEVRKLGLQPIRDCGSFCGVPMIAFDRAIGVMAAFSNFERVFDEGNVELLRVVASQATIALENARLLQEERTKARHLSLLNMISRNAIATLNPDEMLAKITEQLEESLNYEHMVIGVLDYSNREIVVQAEAGNRRGSLGQRIPLGDGLIGHVARDGQIAIYRLADIVDVALKPLLVDTCSAVALPIFYAEQLHGVLSIESSMPAEFSDEEILLLRTVADLIAAALHNAFSFQKAQEQAIYSRKEAIIAREEAIIARELAITDGLTGLKNHRFFMERLFAECTLSDRTPSVFALVLMDLDRFKFVNDAYGHQQGDLVLQRIGQILKLNCRQSDVVARYGGDEFVILMQKSTIEEANNLVTLLLHSISADPFLLEKNIGASFGIACYPVDGSAPRELLRLADVQMYRSKGKIK